MASVVAAAITKYQALGGSPPDLYFGEAPVTDDGAVLQVHPPYVVLTSEAGSAEPIEAGVILETHPLMFEVYADTLAAADTVAERIKFNGGAVSAGSGFVHGTLTALTVGTTNLIRLVSDQAFLAGVGKTGQRVHGRRLRFEVEVKVT